MSALYSTGTVKLGTAAGLGVFRAFKRGWDRSRAERRQREELLARLAAAMRQAAGRETGTARS